MNIAVRPAARTANSFGHINDSQARRSDQINSFLFRGGSVLFLEYPAGEWRGVAWAVAEGAKVRLRFEDGGERLIGTESNDSYTLEWRP